MPSRMFSSIPGLYIVDASSTPTTPHHYLQKYFQILPNAPWGGKISPPPKLGTIALVSEEGNSLFATSLFALQRWWGFVRFLFNKRQKTLCEIFA